MSVSVERFGQGPDLVLLHGWGMNGAVWHGIVPALAARYRVHLVDLPGFGNSPLAGEAEYSLPWLAEQVAAILPDKCHLLGWSLGGLVASRLALNHPERLHSVITVASSPCFMARDEWPGIAPKVLTGFNQMLAGDFKQTIERFLAIQAMGSEHARDDIRQLRHWLAERPAPQLAALEAGLGLLADVDLRDELVQLNLPWLRVYGRLDSLVPKASIPLLDERYPASRSVVLEKASHAPFISHPQQFIEIIEHFVG
ncbi:pimeloyl-ACP methyl ester esterase BioH [Aeromonas dhakensis]|uniref:pimeloyl-ACP methyl ester esterase BioH n=1 Tax=Aeromonas TaxID=642 RepID=UPI000B9B2A38|nr:MULTISPECIES: pimeloyl-ACP methyl ester esterase BioH [Aeromonas]MBL0535312.1 pimeloyl-ACP methyl ester esterase BioH [Aeromonas dhakensis]MBO2901733.1 pimeloyl-ACP methyl ester esterase BioH [Aeromonas dhakensis]MBO2996872.1 pimeloyl-ACP methyl ester esterase BioH [Aeromonas dhakensis]MDH0176193.1 pimeloyl-ACP methyl ester esterase BioH [Aeromonas dhakensis]OZG42777.1 pimeloyl-[acyl-carrier protein] methyl ester esterase [Aeromonas sp. A35_P]